MDRHGAFTPGLFHFVLKQTMFACKKKKKEEAAGYEEVKRLVDVYADDIPHMLDGAAHCKNHEWKRVN